MQACDGSAQTHSLSGNNNQPGGRVASQTSDNAVRNQSLLTGWRCKPARAPVGVVSLGLLIVHQFANHAEQRLVKAFHLSIALGMVSSCTALLDTEGGTKFLHQGRHKVGTPVTQ